MSPIILSLPNKSLAGISYSSYSYSITYFLILFIKMKSYEVAIFTYPLFWISISVNTDLLYSL